MAASERGRPGHGAGQRHEALLQVVLADRHSAVGLERFLGNADQGLVAHLDGLAVHLEGRQALAQLLHERADPGCHGFHLVHQGDFFLGQVAVAGDQLVLVVHAQMPRTMRITSPAAAAASRAKPLLMPAAFVMALPAASLSTSAPAAIAAPASTSRMPWVFTGACSPRSAAVSAMPRALAPAAHTAPVRPTKRSRLRAAAAAIEVVRQGCWVFILYRLSCWPWIRRRQWPARG